MRTIVFSSKPYDERFLSAANAGAGHELTFIDVRLNRGTARLAGGFEAVCAFVNDELSADVLAELNAGGTRLVALRAAGFNNVDLAAARALGMTVTRVPAYSPHAVAEHAVGLILALNRKLHRAYNRVREGNFSLDGLLGVDLYDSTVGVVGTGNIGTVFARIMRGFECTVVAHDPVPRRELVELGVQYVSLDELWAVSDMIALHAPLTPATHHLINATSLARMKHGVMLINTSRGALVDTTAVITALKCGKIGALGLDVYEEEADLFFEDMSSSTILDDVFARLLTFPNVLITGHQGFFTEQALRKIADTTIGSLTAFAEGAALPNEVPYGAAGP